MQFKGRVPTCANSPNRALSTCNIGLKKKVKVRQNRNARILDK